MQKALRNCAVFALLIAAYLTASQFGWLNTLIIPAPSALTQTAWQMCSSGELANHALVSLFRISSGFFISLFAAIILCLFEYFAPRFMGYFCPLINAFRFIPPLSLIGLLILTLGIAEASKIAIIVLACFFPIYLALKEAVLHPDCELIELAKSLQYSAWQRFYLIIIPSGWALIFSGLNIGFGYAFRAIVAAEMIAASSGLGYLINDAFMMFNIPRLYVGILSIFALSVAFERAFLLLGRLYVRA